MELKCDKCGKIDHVLVDGYTFGDRILEGVMFEVRDKNGKPDAIGVTKECLDYFNDLNTKKWLKACQGYCEDLDIAQCPKCGYDVPVWGANKPLPTARVIRMTSGSDLINQIMNAQKPPRNDDDDDGMDLVGARRK